MSLFEILAGSGTFQAIDLQFGRLLRRITVRRNTVRRNTVRRNTVRRTTADEDADLLAVTGALASRERGRGHSCIALADWAGRSLSAEILVSADTLPSPAPMPTLPPLEAWEKSLAASPLVGDGSQPTPLVRDNAGRLYLSRYWHAEQRLAQALHRRLQSRPTSLEDVDLSPMFGVLFPKTEETIDWQAVAATAVLANNVALISGGPGTGKTTTVARILALLLEADPPSRIALAAPTGKAAARLGEAINQQLESLPLDEVSRDRIPRQASTLHRLLGYEPRGERFRHHAGRPLACDALVIDEASMVDLLMMTATLEALPDHARLILLGDKDQLASVETGFVFGDLCRAAQQSGGYSTDLATLYHRWLGRELPNSEGSPQEPPSLLADAAVELHTSYRFRAQPGIGALATAVRSGEGDRACRVLDDPQAPDVRRLEPPRDPGEALLPLETPLARYLAAGSPEEALDRIADFRILCANRRGPWGVERMNTALEKMLARHDHPVGERWYPGRPILVTTNDYQVRLFNGDLGVVWLDEGRLWAFFAKLGPESQIRRLPLAKLPPHDTAWAMTVHKSQGSEFNQVLLVLGDSESAVMSRELLYTGITRARHEVVLVASEAVLRAATLRPSRRTSGLTDALRVGESDRQPKPPKPPISAGETRTEPEPKAESGDPQQLSLFG